MHISKLVIRNFRNFRAASFQLRPGVNTIIGENGSGKTNAFSALRLLLDSSLPYDSRNLTEKDFSRTLGNWQGHWIVISAFFSGLGTNETEKLLHHGVGSGNEDGEGCYSYIFRPCFQVRKKLFELSQLPEPTIEKLLEIQKVISLSDYEGTFLSRGNANFISDEVYAELVGDFDTLSFPDPAEERADKLGTKTPDVLSISKEISCTFVQALRDVVRDLKSYNKSPLINLLAKRGKIADISRSHEITTQVKQLNAEISGLDEIKDLSSSISKTLKTTVGKTYSPGVKIESSLPDEIEELIKSLTILVGDAGDKDYLGHINELSLGGANLVYLSLKLLEYELNHSTDKVAHFLLVEEPEAHIHKHIQRTLFDRMPLQKTQVILSTHSTHISSASRISNMNVLGINGKEANVYFPGQGLEADELSRIERYLEITRITLLFAKGVILVEGDAEQIVIPALLKMVLGVSADELGLSIINVSGSVFSHIAKLFDANRIPRNCAIVTDSDASIIPLPTDASLDNEAQKLCRQSQTAGERRQVELLEFARQNSFVEIYLARHTFEVDFLLAGNLDAVSPTLEAIYTNQSAKTSSLEKLKIKTSEGGGREILRLAEKHGKGWFGLLLAEQITSRSVIPQYILNAVAFAARKQLTPEVLFDIAEYRLNSLASFGMTEYSTLSATLLSVDAQKTPFIGRLKQFSDTLPKDALTLLMLELNKDDTGRATE